MSVEAASLIVACLAGYFAIGLVFATLFVIAGAARIDPDAKDMSLRARAIIFPGAVGLWPLLLAYVIRGARTS